MLLQHRDLDPGPGEQQSQDESGGPASHHGTGGSGRLDGGGCIGDVGHCGFLPVLGQAWCGCKTLVCRARWCWSGAAARRDLAGLHQIPGARRDVAEGDRGQVRGVQALELEVGDDPVDGELPGAEQHGRRSEPDRVGEEDGCQVGEPGEHVDERGVELVQRVPVDGSALGLEDLVEDPRFPARVPVLLELVDQDHGQVQQQDPLDRGQLCPSRPTAVWGWRAPHPCRTSGV